MWRAHFLFHRPHHRGLETYKMSAFISQSKSCLMKFAPVINGGWTPSMTTVAVADGWSGLGSNSSRFFFSFNFLSANSVYVDCPKVFPILNLRLDFVIIKIVRRPPDQYEKRICEVLVALIVQSAIGG